MIKFLDFIKKNGDILSVLFFASILCFNLFLNNDLVLAGDGAGWDGAQYPPVLENFLEMFKNRQIDTYLMQRLGLTALLFLINKLGNWTPTLTEMILEWKIANFILLTSAALVYFKLTNDLKWDIFKRNIVFVLVFFNFPVLKFSSYYPILTDYTAFALTLFLLYAWYSEKKYLLLSVFLFSLFTFPSSILYAPLLIFKKTAATTFLKSRSKNHFQLLGAVFCISFILIDIFALEFNVLQIQIQRDSHLSEWIHFSRIWFALWLSFLISLGVSYLLRFRFSVILQQIDKKMMLAVSIIFIVTRFLIGHYGSPTYLSSFGRFLYVDLFPGALVYPFANLINHFIYYGFAPLIFLVFFKKCLKKIEINGLGFMCFFLISFFFSSHAEPRQVINFIPLLFIIMFNATDLLKLFSKTQWLMIVIFQMIWSRFWYQITPETKNWEEFWLRYMQFQGPWMAEKYYYFYLFCLLFTLLGLLGFVWYRNQFFKNNKTS